MMNAIGLVIWVLLAIVLALEYKDSKAFYYDEQYDFVSFLWRFGIVIAVFLAFGAFFSALGLLGDFFLLPIRIFF